MSGTNLRDAVLEKVNIAEAKLENAFFGGTSILPDIRDNMEFPTPDTHLASEYANAIDAHAHSITLELIDGTTQSIKVAKHIDLTQFGLGDSVRVQVTDAVFINFEKGPE